MYRLQNNWQMVWLRLCLVVYFDLFVWVTICTTMSLMSIGDSFFFLFYFYFGSSADRQLCLVSQVGEPCICAVKRHQLQVLFLFLWSYFLCMYKFYFDYVFKNDIYMFMMQSSYRTRIEGEISKYADRFCEQTRVLEPKHWILEKRARMTSD